MPPETSILDTLENGVLIIDKNLTIRFWNRWLAVQTGISKETAQENNLTTLFPGTSFDVLKRKVKIALKLKSSTFTNSTVEKHILPIELNKITKSIFRHMRQDGVITPLNNNDVSVIIYDASPLLEAKAIIDEQLALVERQARTDILTQCYNRKMFNELLAVEIKKALRHGYNFCLVLLDIDDFKSVNDTHGHLVGDDVLKKIATISRGILRESDLFARWGGEEFSILLPETRIDGGAILADKIRETIENYDFAIPEGKTCSFGITQFHPGTTEDRLITNADNALYHAKNNGKNQVAVYDKETIITWKNSSVPLMVGRTRPVCGLLKTTSARRRG